MLMSLTPVPQRMPEAPPPAYLSDTYHWAYLNCRTLPWLDQPWVVSAILWGNARRLMRSAVEEFGPGQQVLQAAAVYGDFSQRLAARLEPHGSLEVVDVAPIQIANVRRKLAPWARSLTRVADLSLSLDKTYDGVCCFFLLHEVPPATRRAIVDNLLQSVKPGGKIVFVDYHKPRWWHPLAPLMRLIFKYLEPYAPSLQQEDIARLSPEGECFDWSYTRFFGGLYQKRVGIRKA